MSRLSYLDESGVLQPAPNTLLVFIDETGHEVLKAELPVFGLGGCAILAADLEREIHTPWRALRELVNGDASQPLHAAKFPRQYLEAMVEFFGRPTFMRLAVALSDKTKLPDDVPPVDIALRELADRIQTVADRLPEISDVAIQFEHTQRAQKLYQQYFDGFHVLKGGKEIQTLIHWVDAEVMESGVEVADFVVNAVHSQMRNVANGRSKFPLDFQSVFMNVPNFWVSYKQIDAVTGEHPHRMVEAHLLG